MKEFEVQTLHKGKRFYNETKHFLKDPNLNSFKLVKLKVLPAKSLKLIWCFTSEGHHFYCINYILQIKKKKKVELIITKGTSSCCMSFSTKHSLHMLHLCIEQDKSLYLLILLKALDPLFHYFPPFLKFTFFNVPPCFGLAISRLVCKVQ